MKFDNAQKLQHEIHAVEVLKSQLVSVFGEDEQLVKDTIEGETSLHEIIQSVVQDIQETTATIEGLVQYQKKLTDRKVRLDKRIDFLKTLIKTAMIAGEMGKSIQFPTATISMKKTPDKAEIIEEADLPSEFWVIPDPKLSKKLLLTSLKEKESELADLIEARLEQEYPDLKKSEKLEKRKEIRDGLTEDELRPFIIPGAQLVNDGETIQIRMS